MILILHDHTHTTRIGGVAPETAVALAGMLPAEVGLRVQPDEARDVSQAQPADPGYFGLATAIAYDTWGQRRLTDESRLHAEYLAYLRGELSDPRD